MRVGEFGARAAQHGTTDQTICAIIGTIIETIIGAIVTPAETA